MSEQRLVRTEARAEEGDSLAAISRRVVRLYKESYGRGPTRARTYYWRDLVVVLLREGYTPLEQTLSDAGRGGTVSQLRAEFHDVMAPQFRRIVEEELRREVVACMSACHHDPDVNAELFVLAPDPRLHDAAADAPAEAQGSPAPQYREAPLAQLRDS